MHTNNYSFREIQSQDAHKIADLFQLVYQDTSHECREPDNVRKSIEDNSASWFVLVTDEKVVSCAALLRHSWNSFYETGRSVTHPEHRRFRLTS